MYMDKKQVNIKEMSQETHAIKPGKKQCKMFKPDSSICVNWYETATFRYISLIHSVNNILFTAEGRDSLTNDMLEKRVLKSL